MTSASDHAAPSTPGPTADAYAEAPEPGHRVSERASVTVAGFLLLVLAIVYLVQAFGYRLGTLAQPGPGLFPLIIGFGMVLASAGLIWESLRLPRERFVVWPFASYAIRLGIACLASFVYILAIGAIGQFLAGFILCAAMMFAMRMKRWWLMILLSIASSFAVQFLFGTILNVALPAGPVF